MLQSYETIFNAGVTALAAMQGDESSATAMVTEYKELLDSILDFAGSVDIHTEPETVKSFFEDYDEAYFSLCHVIDFIVWSGYVN